ncbi:type 1 periplasmic-binding domain-containing protein [Oceanobacter kriegii]|uniref:hypothetical protein n=1 Tax=Oceanobacter kriegii TaxID=64972 RepID=UPI000484749A|nr:hypothetical protein [Oceanobacter kriegii]
MNPLTLRPGMDACLRWVSRLMLVTLLMSTPTHSLFADAASDRRARVGLNLFRTFVNADLTLDSHVQNNRIPVAMLYLTSNLQAREFRDQLEQTWPSVQGYETEIQVVSLQQLLAQPNANMPAAVFVTERLNAQERQQLVELTIKHQVAVFSPFEGDVEAGILGGLSVTSSVKPTVNLTTLQLSKLSIKSFYLSVARTYE